MGFSMSAKVIKKEIDLTNIVPAVSTTEAALAGVFQWGPLEQRVLVDSEKNLVSRFYKPSNFNAETWFTGASFLAYGNQLYLVRAANTNGTSPILTCTTSNNNSTIITTNTAPLQAGMKIIAAGANLSTAAVISTVVNSTAFTVDSASRVIGSGSESVQFVSGDCVFTAVANTGQVANLAGAIVKNLDHFASKEGNFDSDVLYVARYPGAPGDSLRISQCDNANQFTSVLNCASFGDGATVSINAGSNTALVTINVINQGSNSTAQTAAITAATNFKSNIQITDLIEFGNNISGSQSLKITRIANTVSTVDDENAVATFYVEFEDPLRLIEDQTVTTNLRRYWEFADFVDSAPGQSTYMREHGNSAAYDEVHLVVVDDKGYFSGVPGTILETYKNLSRATDAKSENGTAIYYRSVLNKDSQYVYAVNDKTSGYSNTAINLSSVSNNSVTTLSFNYGQNGADESNVAMSVLASAYDLFSSAEEVDISFLMQGKARGGSAGGQLANYLIDNIAEVRKDVVVFVSPDKWDVVSAFGYELDNVIEFRNTLSSSSYAFLDSGYKYMYDRYNDVYRWVPLNGDMAGLCVRTDTTNDAWWSPAGFNRGIIKNVVKLAWNPREAMRDELYKNGVNPVATFKNQGSCLWGDKTLLAKPSAFDRINVRRLFIVLEKAISTAAKYYLFELNDPFTRAQFRNTVNPYLSLIQGKRGIQAFEFVCDTTNNPPELIDQEVLVGDIYVKPTRSINVIQLNFIAVPTGVTFSEVVGKTGA